MNSSLKIIVTGGAGFIGSHIVDVYIAAGHSVAVIDNFSTGNKNNLNPKARLYEADIRNPDELKRIFAVEKPAVVNHQAAIASVVHGSESEIDETNVTGTKNVLEAAAPYIKKFIFASSGGALNSSPKKIPADESETPTPISAYGRSKLAGEEAVIAAAKKYSFAYCILRPSNVFGPRQNPFGEGGIVAIFTNLAKENKQPTIYREDATRDYVYALDLAHANLLALTEAANETLNIASGTEITNAKVYESIAKIFNWQQKPLLAPARPGEIFRSCLSPLKAERILKWKTLTSFQDGIAQLHALLTR